MKFEDIFKQQDEIRDLNRRLGACIPLHSSQVKIGQKMLKAGFQEAGFSTSNNDLAVLHFTHPEIKGEVRVYGGPEHLECRIEAGLGVTEHWWLWKATPEELLEVVKRLASIDVDGIMGRD